MYGSKPLDTTNATDRCPRCRGNLSKEFDAFGGWDAACLQCGFRGPPPPKPPARKAKKSHASSRRAASGRSRATRRRS